MSKAAYLVGFFGNGIFFSVKDTGTGILPENRDAIFEPFAREDKSRSRAMGRRFRAGTGAGQHGGSVRIAQSTEAGTDALFAIKSVCIFYQCLEYNGHSLLIFRKLYAHLFTDNTAVNNQLLGVFHALNLAVFSDPHRLSAHGLRLRRF